MIKNLLKKTGVTTDVDTVFLPHNLPNTKGFNGNGNSRGNGNTHGAINGNNDGGKYDGKPESSHILQNAMNNKGNLLPSLNQADLEILESRIVDALLDALVDNKRFINNISDSVADKALEHLLNKYDFEPTDKYLQAVESKQQYINQLDAYLEERKNINREVENDLQAFLRETTGSLTKAIESFGIGVQNRIKEAESRHGIDVIRESLFTNRE